MNLTRYKEVANVTAVVLGSVAAIVSVSFYFGTLDTSVKNTEKDVRSIYETLDKINTRLDKMDNRLDTIDRKLSKVETNSNTLTYDLKMHRNSSEVLRNVKSVQGK